MKSDDEIKQILKKPLPVEMRPGAKGKTYPYIPVAAVVEVLNEAFGLQWESEVRKEIIERDEVAVCIRLYYPTETGVHFRDAYGGKERNGITLGNALKSASSSAIKKAAESLGVKIPDVSGPITEEQFNTIVELMLECGKKLTETKAAAIAELDYSEAAALIDDLHNKVRIAK